MIFEGTKNQFFFGLELTRAGECRADSLLLVLLAKMRSGTYVDFREGPPTLVNIVGVGD